MNVSSKNYCFMSKMQKVLQQCIVRLYQHLKKDYRPTDINLNKFS